MTFPDVQIVTVNDETIAAFQSERDFLALSVDLLREATSYICVASCIMGTEKTWSRNQAIVGGHGIRIYKLLTAFLENTVSEKRDISDIIMRIIFETVVNVIYICTFYSNELVVSYLKFSFRHERKLQNTIKENISQRNGVVLPIEDRMLKSIANTERLAGIEIGELNPKDKSPWGGKHLHQRALQVGLEAEYEACFSGMSHNVHGSWQDIFAHHIVSKGHDRFVPTLEWTRPRPQACLALVRLSCDALLPIAIFLGGEAAELHFGPKIDDLLARAHRVDLAHERYLSTREWPAT